QVEHGPRVLEGNVVESVIDDVLAHSLVPVALQVDDRREAIEVRTGWVELQALKIVGIDLQGEVLDLVVAGHGRRTLPSGRCRPGASRNVAPLRRTQAVCEGAPRRSRGATRFFL